MVPSKPNARHILAAFSGLIASNTPDYPEYYPIFKGSTLSKEDQKKRKIKNKKAAQSRKKNRK